MEPSSRKWPPIKSKAKLLVLASGEGSIFEAIVRFGQSPQAKYEVVALLTNKSQAGAVKRAEKLKIPVASFAYDQKNPQEFYFKSLEMAKQLKVDFVALAGFLLLVRNPFFSYFSNRMLNTHPSLLPKYGGVGMYGRKVHQAVLQNKEKRTGVTIHLVNEKYDQGDVLLRHEVVVHESDTVESLSSRVKEAEQSLYPQAINEFVTWKGFC